MLTRNLLALLLTASMLLLLPGTGLAATEARSSSGAEAMLVDLVNDRRAEAGAAPLTARSDLHAIARDWSFTQAERGQMGHNPDLGTQACCWTRITENVARAGGMHGAGASAVARQLMDLWRNSSSHDRAMVDDGVDQVGVGVVIDDDGNAWGTMVFRMCDGTACAGGPQGPAGDRTVSWAPPPPPEPEPAPEPAPVPRPAPEPEPASEPAEARPPATPGPGATPSAEPRPAPTIPPRIDPVVPPSLRSTVSVDPLATPTPVTPSEIDRTVGATNAAPLRAAADIGEPSQPHPNRLPQLGLLAGVLSLGAVLLLARR